MVMHQKEEETGCFHHYPVSERWGDRLACLPAQHHLETTWEGGHGVPLGGLSRPTRAHHRLQSLGYFSHCPHTYGVITLLKDERWKVPEEECSPASLRKFHTHCR